MMSKWRVAVLGLALIVAVGVLAAGLQTVEFRAGVPLPDPGQPQPGEYTRLPFPYAMMERLFDILPWVLLGAAVLGAAIFRRKLRQGWKTNLAVFAAILLLAAFAFGIMPGRLADQEDLAGEEEQVPGPPADLWQPGIPSTQPGSGEDAPGSPGVLPTWVTYLATALLVMPLVWLGWRLVRRTVTPRPSGPGDELQELAARAVDDLRAGTPVEEVVIRCWARMADILAPRAGGIAPGITPRELARLLVGHGVRHDAVAELTRLFEEVRYGAKADEPRRERALAALAAVQEAYDPV